MPRVYGSSAALKAGDGFPDTSVLPKVQIQTGSFLPNMRAHRAFSAFPCLPGVTIRGVSPVSQNKKGAD